MNVILVISDTLRRDHLGCYGNDWIKTPNIDAFASGAVVFDRAYTASFPTVPNRTDVMTGRYTFTYRDWSPLGAEPDILSEVLGEAGVLTMMIADTPHILQHGYNFSRGFAGFEWIRGQENDHWKTSPAEVSFPCDKRKLRAPETSVVQYLRNVSKREREEDYFVARTMRAAADWLAENADGRPFFLYVDTFDPHEPWDPPRHYVDMYDPGYRGEEVIYPRYAPCDFLSEEELRHVRALYAGEVSLVDRWFGHLLEAVDALGLADDTAIILTTDHGFYHGEHGMIGKSLITEAYQGAVPLYEEVCHIPLIVRIPGVEPRRHGAMAQPPDLAPTVMELLGAEVPERVQGKSLVPVLRGRTDEIRDMAVSSCSIIYGQTARRWTTVIKGDWALMYGGDPRAKLEGATSFIVDSSRRTERELFEGGGKPELYHIPTDPGHTRNVIAEHEDVARRLHAEHVRLLEKLGTPEEHLQHRRVFALE